MIVETRHFTDLAKSAFEGLVTSHERELTAFLTNRPETTELGDARCAELSSAFINRLLGLNFLKALLGLAVPTTEDLQAMSREAAEDLLRSLLAANVDEASLV